MYGIVPQLETYYALRHPETQVQPGPPRPGPAWSIPARAPLVPVWSATRGTWQHLGSTAARNGPVQLHQASTARVPAYGQPRSVSHVSDCVHYVFVRDVRASHLNRGAPLLLTQVFPWTPSCSRCAQTARTRPTDAAQRLPQYLKVSSRHHRYRASPLCSALFPPAAP